MNRHRYTRALAHIITAEVPNKTEQVIVALARECDTICDQIETLVSKINGSMNGLTSEALSPVSGFSYGEHADTWSKHTAALSACVATLNAKCSVMMGLLTITNQENGPDRAHLFANAWNLERFNKPTS